MTDLPAGPELDAKIHFALGYHNLPGFCPKQYPPPYSTDLACVGPLLEEASKRGWYWCIYNTAGKVRCFIDPFTGMVDLVKSLYGEADSLPHAVALAFVAAADLRAAWRASTAAQP